MPPLTTVLNFSTSGSSVDGLAAQDSGGTTEILLFLFSHRHNAGAG